MRRGFAALTVVCVTAFWLVVAASADLTLGSPQQVPSPWPAQNGYTWTYGSNSVTESYYSRPGSTKPIMVTYSWTLPATVPAAGAKGSITVKSTGGDQDGIAPAISISSDKGLIRCTGITNTPSYGTGCADGDHASAGTSVQPNETKTATQEFLIQGGAGKVTIVTTGPQNVVYEYTGSATAPATTTTSTEKKLIVVFSPHGGGISGRQEFETVGKQDRQAGYKVKPTYVTGSPAPLTITRGVFGQHLIKFTIVSGRYQAATVVSSPVLTLHVRVSSSDDSSCPVGSDGIVVAYVGRRGNRGTQITLCGETIHEPSEQIHLNVE